MRIDRNRHMNGTSKNREEEVVFSMTFFSDPASAEESGVRKSLAGLGVELLEPADIESPIERTIYWRIPQAMPASARAEMYSQLNSWIRSLHVGVEVQDGPLAVSLGWWLRGIES